MRLTDEEVETFRRLYLQDCGLDLPPDVARAAVHRALMLFEAFAAWLATERAAGRCLDDEPAQPSQETERR